MRWCSAEGIAPEDVDQAVIERFGRALCEDSFHSHPLDAWQRTVGGWNRAVRHDPRLAAGAARRHRRARGEAYVLPLTDVPG